MASKVHIVQLLCPERHCIMATYYESPNGKELPEIACLLREKFDAFVKAGANPWCGICKSRDLHIEDRATKYATIAEAKPAIDELARQQAITREYFKASRG